MPMAMMQIRVMRVFVTQRRVAVPMRMRLGHRAVMDMAVSPNGGKFLALATDLLALIHRQ